MQAGGHEFESRILHLIIKEQPEENGRSGSQACLEDGQDGFQEDIRRISVSERQGLELPDAPVVRSNRKL